MIGPRTLNMTRAVGALACAALALTGVANLTGVAPDVAMVLLTVTAWALLLAPRFPEPKDPLQLTEEDLRGALDLEPRERGETR